MILIDNTVLSNFALIHQPESICLAFVDEVGTTEQVFQELERGMQLGRLPICQWTWLPRLQLTENEKEQYQKLAEHIGAGEASCLAMAVHRSYNIATDDKDARQWAVRLSIPHTGTLGILAILVKHGQITHEDGNAWLTRMITAGYHSPIRTLDSLIAS
jgi:predicted nucleic acid-binding protein